MGRRCHSAIFSCSAATRLVLSPMATSLVTLLPPMGSTEVWRGEPSMYRARSVVPAPMSATATPSSRSVSESTASPEASDETTSSSMRTPAWRTHLVRFCSAVAEPWTMCVSTSRRMALMPRGSLTPSWPSTVKSRGRTCRTSRFDGMVTARATSVARSMSSRLTSRCGPDTATAPREFWLSTWLAADTHERRLEPQPGQPLGALDGGADGRDRLLDVDDDALLEAGRRRRLPCR